MKKLLSYKRFSFIFLFLLMCIICPVKGDQITDSPTDMHEELNVEKQNLEKLQMQLQILEAKEGDKKQDQKTESQTSGRINRQPVTDPSIVINPNENIVLTKEVDAYDVPLYSIDATQVKIADILQALSASFGKSIIVDDEIDHEYLSSYINVSIKKCPLQDILEAVLGMRGLEFIQNEDSIFVTSLAKLSIDTASEYYRDKGIHLYQKAQIKYPNDRRIVKAYFELGNYYYELGFNFLALQQYQIIMEKYRGTPLAKEALFKLGRCYDNLNDPESARRAYFQFMYSYPKDPLVENALLAIGDSFVNQGLYYKAIDVYDRVIQECTHEEITTKAQVNMAKTYVKMGNYRKALQSFLQARERNHSKQVDPEIEYQIANCLYLLNEYQDAGNVFGNLLLNVQDSEFGENANFLLADCFYKQNNYLGAYQIFKKAIDTYPKSTKVPYGIYCMGKNLNLMNMPESAIKTFREGMQAYPKDPYARKMAYEIGRCYYSKGDYWLAYNAFDSFVRQYSDDELVIEGMFGIADALFNDKKYAEAINSYLDVIKTCAEEKIKRYAFKRIGECYECMGNLEQARKAYLMSSGIEENTMQITRRTDNPL